MTKSKLARRAGRIPTMNILRVAAAVASTETVTIGDTVFEVYTAAAAVTAGRETVDVSAGGTKATQTLTLTGVVNNNETVTINGRVYTFKTTLTGAADEVLIGASAAISLDNLKSAINATTGAGTTYGTGTTAHTTVEATTNTDTTQVIQARVNGTAANSYGTTETITNGSWGAATMAGGAQPTASEFTTALTTAINASTTCRFAATRISANEVLIVDKTGGTNTVACTETLAGANNVWAAATSFAGESPPAGQIASTVLVARVPTATEVALGTMHFNFNFAPSAVLAFVRVTSSGVAKAWDGGTTISGKRVSLDNTGTTDWAATDTVMVLASN